MHPTSSRTAGPKCELPLQTLRFPSRFAATGFELDVPVGWVEQTVPDEDTAFDQWHEFVTLAHVCTPDTAFTLTVSARPALEDGAVSDWAAQLLEHHGLQFWTLGEQSLGCHGALAGEGVRGTAFGPVRSLYVFAEDGQRLLMLQLEGPEALGGVLASLWNTILGSFRLREPFGPTVTLWPPLEVPAEPSPATWPQPMQQAGGQGETGAQPGLGKIGSVAG